MAGTESTCATPSLSSHPLPHIYHRLWSHSKVQLGHTYLTSCCSVSKEEGAPFLLPWVRIYNLILGMLAGHIKRKLNSKDGKWREMRHQHGLHGEGCFWSIPKEIWNESRRAFLCILHNKLQKRVMRANPLVFQMKRKTQAPPSSNILS